MTGPRIENVVILAGGAGTRLWPASRANRPKQFLELGGGRSLFLQTLERALALEPAGRILVVTHESQAPAIRSEASGRAPGLAILAEPEARNTGPAVAYACAWLEARGQGARPAMVLPADHVIQPLERFLAAAAAAAALAAEGRLVVFGVPPTRPETGYGYLEAGESLAGGRLVTRFHEKPDEAQARTYLDSGRFYWNSGMFTFTPSCFLAEAQAVAPDLVRGFAAARTALAEAEPLDSVVAAGDTLRSVYRELPSISIDYAVMERSRRVAMVEADFAWSDVGSWDEAARLAQQGGETLAVEAKGNFVLSDIPVALAGVEDLIVVIRDGVALVCRRGRSQLVRDIVEQAKAKGLQDLL